MEGLKGVHWECGPKQAQTLLREYGMEECKGKDATERSRVQCAYGRFCGWVRDVASRKPCSGRDFLRTGETNCH